MQPQELGGGPSKEETIKQYPLENANAQSICVKTVIIVQYMYTALKLKHSQNVQLCSSQQQFK